MIIANLTAGTIRINCLDVELHNGEQLAIHNSFMDHPEIRNLGISGQISIRRGKLNIDRRKKKTEAVTAVLNSPPVGLMDSQMSELKELLFDIAKKLDKKEKHQEVKVIEREIIREVGDGDRAKESSKVREEDVFAPSVDLDLEIENVKVNKKERESDVESTADKLRRLRGK